MLLDTGLLTGIAGELAALPGVALSLITGAFRTLFANELPHRRDFVVRIHGGTFAHPHVYVPMRDGIRLEMPRPPITHLPHGTVLDVGRVHEYMDSAPEPQEATIEVGHSVGGYSCLDRLLTKPETVLAAVLLAVPAHPERISPKHHKFVQRVFGVDVTSLPPRLERLTEIFTRPDLLRKIIVIASTRDGLFPPDVMEIEGAESYLVNCRHVKFMTDANVRRIVQSIIGRFTRAPQLAA